MMDTTDGTPRNTGAENTRAPQTRPLQIDGARKSILNRLNRAAGQLNAVIEGVKSGKNCTTTVTQLAATIKALNRVGFLIITTSMRECLDEIDGEGRGDGDNRKDRQSPDQNVDMEQLEKLFLMLS